MLLAPGPTDSRLSVVHVKRIEEPYRSPSITPKLAPPQPRWEARLIRPVIAQDVLLRTRRVEEMVRHLRSVTPVERRAVEAVRRLARQTVRREESPPTPMQVRPLIPLPSPATREATREARSDVIIRDYPQAANSIPKAANPASQAANPTPPSFNLDALTTQVMDQIDRRVVAWRERMGRF